MLSLLRKCSQCYIEDWKNERSSSEDEITNVNVKNERKQSTGNMT